MPRWKIDAAVLKPPTVNAVEAQQKILKNSQINPWLGDSIMLICTGRGNSHLKQFQNTTDLGNSDLYLP